MGQTISRLWYRCGASKALDGNTPATTQNVSLLDLWDLGSTVANLKKHPHHPWKDYGVCAKMNTYVDYFQ